MRVLVFTEGMGIGGTEKAACRWAIGLHHRKHTVLAASFAEGPRKESLTEAGVDFRVVLPEAQAISQLLRDFSPDVIHAHMAGFPSPIDVLFGGIKASGKKIPIVQTNIFGRLDNPAENEFVKFRLFVCWSSCVQTARRAFKRLDHDFFKNASVAVNPLDPDDGPAAADINEFRRNIGVAPSEILLGQLCRPDPIRWNSIPLEAFRKAQQVCGNLKFLIREPPPEVAAALRKAPDSDRFVILPVTSQPEELRRTEAALDAILHYSRVGESFGYGIAEPMNLGKPAIVNFAPWNNLGPLELARHGECGFAESSLKGMTRAIVTLASDTGLRQKMGQNARVHIRQLANPDLSLDRLENGLRAAVGGMDNPFAGEDLLQAQAMAAYLQKHQFGHSLAERISLRPFYYRVRLSEWKNVRQQRSRQRSFYP